MTSHRLNHRPAGRRVLAALGLFFALLGATTAADAGWQTFGGYYSSPNGSGAIRCSWVAACASGFCTDQGSGGGTEATAENNELYGWGKAAIALNTFSVVLYVRNQWHNENLYGAAGITCNGQPFFWTPWRHYKDGMTLSGAATGNYVTQVSYGNNVWQCANGVNTAHPVVGIDEPSTVARNQGYNSYGWDDTIKTIVQKRCAACHTTAYDQADTCNSAAPAHTLHNLSTSACTKWHALKASGAAVANSSYWHLGVRGAMKYHRMGSAGMTNVERKKIIDWIDCGARQNTGTW